jgi:imidazoleglycerol phosphate synthase glutamine amidotransferase subunit HisH
MLRDVLKEAEFFLSRPQLPPRRLANGAVLATGDYGYVFPTIVGEGNVIGAQFHPEKSQRAGLELLAAFARWHP